MAELRRLAIAVRVLVALAAAGLYLAVGATLAPAARAAARFGLGILLFGLLVDLGRSIAGTGRPLRGALGPHRQQASSQVDEAYEDLRIALRAYVDEGRTEPALLEQVRRAGEAGLDRAGAQRLADHLERGARPRGPQRSLLAVRLLSGAIVTAGVGLAAAQAAEGLGMALFPPVLLVVGTSLATLQWRALDAGARWIGLAIGLVGVAVFALGALRYLTASVPLGATLLALAGGGLAATLRAAWHPRSRTDPWGAIEQRLETRLTRLRRAFLLALVASVVVLALEPLTASSGLLALVVQLAAIGAVTVLAFAAVEGAGTWLTLARGRRRAEREARQRREALAAVLETLDRGETDPLEEARS